MKLAVLCDFAFWETRNGAGLRIDSLCRRLTQICDLTVITTARPDPETAAPAQYRLVDGRALAARDPGHPPVPGARPDQAEGMRAIAHLVAHEDIAAVLIPGFSRGWMARALPAHVVRIIDPLGCQSQHAQSALCHGLVPDRCMDVSGERAALAEYDIALAMSDADLAALAALTDTPLVTAPFRLPVRDLAPVRPVYPRPAGPDRTLLFVAAQDPVNAATLAYLLHQVMPLVPGPTHLRVIGDVTMPDAVALPHCTIERHRYVPDLMPIYAQTDVALNPAFAGGGVKARTLEAMAHGVPVITSDTGAQGLRALLPDRCIANDKECFAHKVGQLLATPADRAAVAAEICDRMRAEPAAAWLTPFQALLTAAIDTRRIGATA